MRTYSFYLLLLFCCFASWNVRAQDNIIKSLERYEAGCGIVAIHQDSRLADLLSAKHLDKGSVGETRTIKESGYRIQVYAGSNSRESRNAAIEMEGVVKSHFPEMQVYTIFNSPRWLCQVGDYRTMEEAYAIMKKMKQTGVFNEISIVKSQIIIPL